MATLNRLHVPSFDLTWLTINNAPPNNAPNDPMASNLILVPGGGGSTKSGVLNQIQIGRVNSNQGFTLLNSFMTDTPEKSNFCSAVSTGVYEGKPLVCAVMDSVCVLFIAKQAQDGEVKFERKCEFQADFEPSFASVNCCMVGIKHIITGGEDKICRLWAITEAQDDWSVKLVREMHGHTGPIMAISKHNYRPWLVTSSKDGSCKIWDASNGQELVHLPSVDGADGSKRAGTSMECRGCVFSPDCKFIYSIQSGKRGPSHIVKWSINDDAYDKDSVFKVSPEDVIFASKVPLTKLRMDSTGVYLATGASDGMVALYDTTQSKRIKAFQVHDLPVTGLAFAPASIAAASGCVAMVVSCSADNKLGTCALYKSSAVWILMLAALLLAVLAALYLVLISP